MLRRPPTNLNRQSEDATILLIREVLAKGIVLSEVRFPFPHGSFPVPVLIQYILGLRRCPGQYHDVREIPLIGIPRDQLHRDDKGRLEVQDRRRCERGREGDARCVR